MYPITRILFLEELRRGGMERCLACPSIKDSRKQLLQCRSWSMDMCDFAEVMNYRSIPEPDSLNLTEPTHWKLIRFMESEFALPLRRVVRSIRFIREMLCACAVGVYRIILLWWCGIQMRL